MSPFFQDKRAKIPGSSGPYGRWAERVRAVAREHWAQLRAEHSSPARLGIAVGVGVFAGCSPFHGFQFLLALGLALVLRLNKLAVLLGLQISAPPVTPLVVVGGLQLGALLLHGRLLPWRLHALWAAAGPHPGRTFLADFVVGSLVLGVTLGLALGTLSAILIHRHRAAVSATEAPRA